MKTPPVCPKFEAGDWCACEFDPQADFTRFLEEAKQHACEGNFIAVPRQNQEMGNGQFKEKEKNRKKSWRSSLFSWLKTEKKNKTVVETLHGTTMPKLRRGIVSGPIQYGSAVGITSRPRKPTSGPLAGLFNSSRREEDGVPYICLNQLNNPHEVQSYGPVYLVT